MKRKVAVVTGSKTKGSNMAALIRAALQRDLGYEVSTAVVPSDESPAKQVAEQLDVPVQVVEPGDDYAVRLLRAIGDVDLVCLAGYLRLLPDEVLDRFQGRILNIHPALLPKFGGKGMYGMHVHRAVLAAGESESGCSVHLVTNVYDEGPVLLQMRCPVLNGDTPEVLASRVLKLEHEAYPAAVHAFARGMA